MQGNSTTPHAAHDELLLARLYGGDVDEQERARALDLVAACEECAGFFADLGAIATATAAMAVPPRPRDFTLTEADATRLRRRSSGGALLGWFGWTRALGGSMAAIGLVGVVALGAISAFGTGSAMAPLSDLGTERSAAGPLAPSAAPAYLSGSPTPAPELNGGGTKMNGATDAIGVAGSPVLPPVSATASSQAAGSPVATSATGGTAQDGSGYGPGPTADGRGAGSPAAASSEDAFSSQSTGGGPGSGEPDVRPIALAGSIGLLALGLLLLAAPRLATRRARR